MNWESPNLSKGDVEKLTVIIDDYIFYAKQDGDGFIQDAQGLISRLEDHLSRYEQSK